MSYLDDSCHCRDHTGSTEADPDPCGCGHPLDDHYYHSMFCVLCGCGSWECPMCGNMLPWV